ncbi:MAG: outer membrane protein assembly factor BamB family protein [Planctomycetota bacterium]|jgi:outer membrane protein assembly factor BamB
MEEKSLIYAVLVSLLVCTLGLSEPNAANSIQEKEARKILNETGIKGGLIVHIGCADGKLTAALCPNDSYLVHGLDTDVENIEKAREYIQSLGMYGKVCADSFDGERLPYIDNLVNLIVVDNLGDVSMEEVRRVLAPKGVAYIQSEGKWTKATKSWPEQMDEWTHYLHDPQGTMVGRDRIVALPRRLKWIGGPKWLRNHDFMASLSGMVSSGGKIFYIIDEGLRKHIYLPARWAVVARDAFNGTILWKRRIDKWFPHTWPFKSGPGDLPRRIVALGDKVYVTLGITAPLSVLDAATGETIRTYDQTNGTEEIVLADGVLYLVVDPDKESMLYKHETNNRGKERDRVNRDFGWSKESPDRLVMAISADTGKILWSHENNIATLTLAVQGRQVFFYDGQHIVALNRESGKEEWVSETVAITQTPATGYAPRLIADENVVVLSTKGRVKGSLRRGGRLAGISSATGKILWRADQLNSGHFSPEDLFLIDGVVWTAHTGKAQTKGTHFLGVDARTGQTKHDFIADQIQASFMHQRCYPGRATERYIMTSGTGTEFLELGTEHCELHHWLRGSCIYGIMPCNGLIYRPPETCACYYQSKLAHFCALAPESSGRSLTREAEQKDRLVRGPVYKKIVNRKSKIENTNDWPTYRHDVERSGMTKTAVSADLSEVWRTNVGGKLSTMTASGGKLFVSDIDKHTVHAIDAGSGGKIWSYTTGGRVDSPPTIYNGLVIFGCADGWVYCLRSSDGELAWRYRAAPGPDKLVSYQQVESVWPLHGSVLVYDGVVYCLAGRNMFVDGGMRMVRLDPVMGKLLSETVMDDKDPRTGKNLQTLMARKAVPVTNADILSCDGKYIYMKSQKFNLAGKRVDIEVADGKQMDQTGDSRHLFCPTGFLDDYWFHRSYWIYGKNAGEGHGEYIAPRTRTQVGRLIVFDEESVYSFFAHNVGNNINPRTYYTLYSARKDLVEPEKTVQEKVEKRRKKNERAKTQQPKIQRIWELAKPELLANAMVLAGDNLFIAGPPDVADEEKTYDYVFGADERINRQMLLQEEAWQGKQGALLWAVSADTGEKLSERRIPAIPVWDGMIAANDRLYMALDDGSVMCMGADR